MRDDRRCVCKNGQRASLHEAIEQDGTAFEATIIGDAMYMNMDGEITKLPMTLAKRQEMFAGLFDARLRIAGEVPTAALLDRRSAIFTGPVPLHPGAVDYYRDLRG